MNTIDRLLEVLIKEEEFGWQEFIYELIREEKMDPWDIDISLLVKRFLQVFKKAKEINFKIPGKIILACAILLRMQSKAILETGIQQLDALFGATPEEYEDLNEGTVITSAMLAEKPRLIPRIPQPRKRKVSVYDLIKALEKALEVEERRKRRVVFIPPPKRKSVFNISDLIKKIYSYIKKLSKKKKEIYFDELLPKKDKKEIIYTFLPLLYLETDNKIDIYQDKSFGDIKIKLR